MKATPRVSMIAAMGLNRVIGRDNQLPWHLPEDLKYFRSMTWGKPIVMGRKTFESLGRPLPGRTNIVVTAQPDLDLVGAKVVGSLEEALSAASNQAELDGVDEIMIIGGAKLYEQMLGQTDRIYLTLVEAEPDGDAWFPALPDGQWKLVEESVVAAGEDYPAHRYQVLDRV